MKKVEMVTRAKQMLNTYQPGHVLHDDDHAFAMALLALHPDAQRKIGCGVKHIEINDGLFGSVCFWIVRTDDTRTDFSYRKCIANPNVRSMVIDAMRHAVWPQCLAFRKRQFEYSDHHVCEITGERLTETSCHVDHVTPFHALATAFIKSHPYDMDTLMPPSDATMGRRLKQGTFRDEWLKYHDEHAVLRLLSPRANEQRGGAV